MPQVNLIENHYTLKVLKLKEKCLNYQFIGIKTTYYSCLLLCWRLLRVTLSIAMTGRNILMYAENHTCPLHGSIILMYRFICIYGFVLNTGTHDEHTTRF